MALVSIVIPIYNVETYLPQCLDSVLAQTLTDIEILLVDDGSTDGCPAICDAYRARDSRVRVLHKQNGGLVSAWKAGVLAATADYVGFVDGDDWVDPTFFADLYRGITAAGADIADGELTREQPDRPVSRLRDSDTIYEGPEGIRRLLALYFRNCLEPYTPKWPISYSRCDKLYRRGLLLDNMDYFSEHIALDEDRLANAAMLADCRRVVTLAHTGKYHYRILAGSMSDNFDESAAGAFSDFTNMLLTIAADKGLDREPVDIFLGDTAYRRVYRAAAAAGGSVKAKCAYIRRLLAPLPAGALGKFARARGGAGIRLFCALLQAGAIAPCVWLVSLHASRTTVRKSVL